MFHCGPTGPSLRMSIMDEFGIDMGMQVGPCFFGLTEQEKIGHLRDWFHYWLNKCALKFVVNNETLLNFNTNLLNSVQEELSTIHDVSTCTKSKNWCTLRSESLLYTNGCETRHLECVDDLTKKVDAQFPEVPYFWDLMSKGEFDITSMTWKFDTAGTPKYNWVQKWVSFEVAPINEDRSLDSQN